MLNDVAQLIQGNEDAFAELVRQTRGLLMSLAYGLLLNREEAHDAVQDCYLRFWRSRKKLDPDGNLKAYLSTILRNVCLTRLKRRKPQVSLDVVPEPAVSGDRAGALALKSVLAAAMGVLSEKEREIVALIHYMGMDSREVGRLLGQSDSTVRSRYQSARVRMRNYIIRNHPEFAGGI